MSQARCVVRGDLREDDGPGGRRSGLTIGLLLALLGALASPPEAGADTAVLSSAAPITIQDAAAASP